MTTSIQHWILTYCIILLSNRISGVVSDNCRHTQYTFKENSRFNNHRISSTTVRNRLICERTCNLEASCRSVNWNQGEKTCEINDAVDDSHPTDLVLEAGWSYFKNSENTWQCDYTKCPRGTSCKKQCSNSGLINRCTECMQPIGMEDNRIKNSQITASTFVAGTWAPYLARLNHDTGWSTHKENLNQWIQVQPDQAQYLTGLKIQGIEHAWVKYFKVHFTEDGIIWEFVSDEVGGPAKIFKGNTDDHSTVINLFPRPILASAVRIRPTEWKRFIHIRMEWLGCLRS